MVTNNTSLLITVSLIVITGVAAFTFSNYKAKKEISKQATFGAGVL
jgi:hypothetical protein